MKPEQHKRYLVYLRRYEYFGRGRAKLDVGAFAAIEERLASLDPASRDDRPERAALLYALLRD